MRGHIRQNYVFRPSLAELADVHRLLRRLCLPLFIVIATCFATEVFAISRNALLTIFLSTMLTRQFFFSMHHNE
jgi:hypothetical protein